jgi:hypothetical protein
MKASDFPLMLSVAAVSGVYREESVETLGERPVRKFGAEANIPGFPPHELSKGGCILDRDSQ